MFHFKMRRALQRHRAADVDVGGVDLLPGEAERGKQVEARLIHFLSRDFQRYRNEISA